MSSENMKQNKVTQVLRLIETVSKYNIEFKIIIVI